MIYTQISQAVNLYVNITKENAFMQTKQLGPFLNKDIDKCWYTIIICIFLV